MTSMLRRKKKQRSEPIKPEPPLVGRIVLLGSGNSGKTTIAKQCVYSDLLNVMVHQALARSSDSSARSRSVPDAAKVKNPAFSGATLELTGSELDSFKERLRNFIVEASEFVTKTGEVLFDMDAEEELAAAQISKALEDREPLGAEEFNSLIPHLTCLWGYELFRDTYWNLRNTNYLEELQQLNYFMEKLQENPDYGGNDWVPELDDYLRLTQRTSGNITTDINLGEKSIQIVDTGGQSSERRKWEPVFEQNKLPTAVFFVVGVGDFNHNCFENHSLNRMEDAISLYKNLTQDILRKFKNQIISVNVIFNKTDILESKTAEGISFQKVTGLDSLPTEQSFDEILVSLEAQFRENTSEEIKQAKTLRTFNCVALKPNDVREALEPAVLELIM